MMHALSRMPAVESAASRLFAYGALAREILADIEADKAERMDAYLAALHSMDWHYAMAEGDAYRQGRKQNDTLLDLQEELDPMGEIWRRIAPPGFAVPQPRVAPLDRVKSDDSDRSAS
jgi:hypothetical protein